MPKNTLTFLKLGGSLITDKRKSLTHRPEVLERAAAEIAQAREANPELQLLIGHGSGSFGHAVANQYQTQAGGSSPTYWQGFVEVWKAARKLNQIVMEHLSSAGLPVIAFPPSAGIMSENGSLQSWDTRPLAAALSNGLIPVVQGDVVFDTVLGGTIFSTEQVFQTLGKAFQPSRIMLAGLDAGIYLDPDHPQDIISKITPAQFSEIQPALSGAAGVDVTGGMQAKVQMMLAMVQQTPCLEVRVFSGAKENNIRDALDGAPLGTLISA